MTRGFTDMEIRVEVRQPNEKGHVERLVDFSRSNFLVPVPRVELLEVLNVRLTDD